MINDLLKTYGLSIEILETLSFESKLDISLKQELKHFDKSKLINEVISIAEWLDASEILKDVSIDYRIKSVDSIMLKYEKYYPNHQVRKVFNDILGFRAFCSDYSLIKSIEFDRFRVADMSEGKANDDGYRGVHLYFQKTPRCYPIEIQFNTFYDRQLNDWLHEYVYKNSFDNSVGKCLREFYECGDIKNEKEFKEKLEYVLFNS